MAGSRGPLVTAKVHAAFRRAQASGGGEVICTLDLGLTTTPVTVAATEWRVGGTAYPFLEDCRERTVYHWADGQFSAAARFSAALVKLVPTEWGTPTFEIDGIKMLPSAEVSPYEDARRKVERIRPVGKQVLDTCAGLGYFAAWCLAGGAREVRSFEKNSDVLWLRTLNPWSPPADPRLVLEHGDVTEQIRSLPASSVDAILHDPPRFGIAGELYAQSFYDELARVLRRRGLLFHYTGAPNRRSSGRDLPAEVSVRLRRAGFATEPALDGVLATRGERA
ncbi:MAG: SAM-dependent methyltransferase [Proteobacteria bacterium]|nr:SAM-dependent methyltransferase [Pseudomonadota bacterium]